MEKFDPEEIRANLFGLTVKCPFSDGNPCDCQLYTVRQMTMRERKEWVNDLSDEECESLYRFHMLCLRKKEA